MNKDELFSEDDLATWEHVSRSVTPLAGKEIKPLKQDVKAAQVFHNIPTKHDLEKLIAERSSVQKTKPKTQAPYIKHGDMVGMDKSSANKLRKGAFPIEARLDMHGRTQDEAWEGLKYFIKAAYNMNKRCVLVITGKGNGGEGILKNQVPRWLNNEGLREYVLGFSYAIAKHGGHGAIYILLKKKH